MGKKGDLRDFEHSMPDLSISESVNLLGFSCTTLSRVYREWYEKEKMCIVDSTVGISNSNNHSLQPRYAEKHLNRSRRPHQVPYLSTKNRNLRLYTDSPDFRDRVSISAAISRW